ncbi:MAG: IclR family transcriptional regulator [Alphaproteobacteria bacterium]|nr:MAG: IclR family transcriptional regulator [Alphaproteobacteria bacterium]
MKTVRSVERAIRLLLLVAQSDQPLALSEISRTTGIDKATALRLLQTLIESQLLRRDLQTRRYSPSGNLWQLPKSWHGDLRHLSMPHLETLRRATEETVSLVCPRGLERVVVEALAALHELCVVPAIGSAQPIYAGASGKVIMAFMPDAERERVISLTGLKPVTPASISDKSTYLAVLSDVRNKGYAFSSGDVTVGASALAAPVFDSDDSVAAVVAVRCPDVRMPPERVIQIAPLVIQAAHEISRRLGHEPDRLEIA